MFGRCLEVCLSCIYNVYTYARDVYTYAREHMKLRMNVEFCAVGGIGISYAPVYVTVHAKRWDKSAKFFFELALHYENTTPWEPS